MDIQPESVALARNVLTAYRSGPAIGPSAVEAWDVLASGTTPLFQKIIDCGIKPQVSIEKYADARAMFTDIRAGRILVDWQYVHDTHPLLSQEQRIKFMVVHDVLAHHMRLSYSWEDEVQAYNAHALLLPPKARPAVFAEIVVHASAMVLDGQRCLPYKGVLMTGEMRMVHERFGWP